MIGGVKVSEDPVGCWICDIVSICLGCKGRQLTEYEPPRVRAI